MICSSELDSAEQNTQEVLAESQALCCGLYSKCVTVVLLMQIHVCEDFLGFFFLFLAVSEAGLL